MISTRCSPHVHVVLPEGFWNTSRDFVSVAVGTVLWLMYAHRPRRTTPASSMIPEKIQRNQEIVRRYMAGENAPNLAREYGISVRRLNRLIHRFRHHGSE
jgi:hypothetical protein